MIQNGASRSVPEPTKIKKVKTIINNREKRDFYEHENRLNYDYK